MDNLRFRIAEFMKNKARSCSMDFGCITPEYVYRMCGGTMPLNEIEQAQKIQDSQELQARMSDLRSSARSMFQG